MILRAFLHHKTASSDFPVTAGAYQTEIGGSSDVFVCHTAFNASVIPSTNTSTSTTGSGTSLDTTTFLLIGAGGIVIVVILVIMLKRK